MTPPPDNAAPNDAANPKPFVSRAGSKLLAAIDAFKINPTDLICADLGCNTGGFTDCLLRHGATKVYAIDTGYGVLAWALRKDDRVAVMERTNALHAELPEPVDLVVIDVAWTRQHLILPAAKRLLKPTGVIISLIKPHYEAEQNQLRKGVLPVETAEQVIEMVLDRLKNMDLQPTNLIKSPIIGRKGNEEYLALIQPHA